MTGHLGASGSYHTSCAMVYVTTRLGNYIMPHDLALQLDLLSVPLMCHMTGIHTHSQLLHACTPYIYTKLMVDVFSYNNTDAGGGLSFNQYVLMYNVM